MRFDASEARILVPKVTEACHQHPLERVLTMIIQRPLWVFEFLQPLLLFLIECPFPHHRTQRGGHDAFTLSADGVLQLGYDFSSTLVRATAAVHRFRRYIVFDHDRRIHRDEIQLCHLLIIATACICVSWRAGRHLRLEDESAPVGQQQRCRRLEVLRLPLLGGYEVIVPDRPR